MTVDLTVVGHADGMGPQGEDPNFGWIRAHATDTNCDQTAWPRAAARAASIASPQTDAEPQLTEGGSSTGVKAERRARETEGSLRPGLAPVDVVVLEHAAHIRLRLFVR